jgi:hypothetical protein
MNNTSCVRYRQSLGDLRSKSDSLGDRQFAALEARSERSPSASSMTR